MKVLQPQWLIHSTRYCCSKTSITLSSHLSEPWASRTTWFRTLSKWFTTNSRLCSSLSTLRTRTRGLRMHFIRSVKSNHSVTTSQMKRLMKQYCQFPSSKRTCRMKSLMKEPLVTVFSAQQLIYHQRYLGSKAKHHKSKRAPSSTSHSPFRDSRSKITKRQRMESGIH
jgi:hypothetical protein